MSAPEVGPASGSGGPDRPAAPLPSIAAPKGGGAIQGLGETFATNPATGTGTLTVPLPLSPGRGGFGPQLALSYDAGNGNGPFGFGWALFLPSVGRRTARGLPRYDDDEQSDTFVLAGAEDLVPVLTAAGAPEVDRAGAGYAVYHYRPRVEGAFARIERWVHLPSGRVHWRTISRDNLTTLYGTTGDSRVESAGRTFSWLVSASYDDRGNTAVYEYAAEDDAGVALSRGSEQRRDRGANRYLKRIRYGNRVSRLVDPVPADPGWMFEVVFDYDEGHLRDVPPDPARPAAEQHRRVHASEAASRPWTARPDPFSNHRAGFEVRTHRRCHRVLMFHRFPELGANPVLVRSLDLDYADLPALGGGTPVAPDAELAHQGSTRFASFVRSMTLTGYAADPAAAHTLIARSMPPLEFTYSRAEISAQARTLDAESARYLLAGVDERSTQWVDLDGEGLPGVLTRQPSAWHYAANQGGGTFGALQPVPTRPHGAAGGEQLIDLDGNGRLDAVSFGGASPGFHRRTAADGWEPQRPFRSLPAINWDDPNLRLVDLNGDGHADLLLTEMDAVRWYQSMAEDGFTTPQRVPAPRDEGEGPRLVFASDDGSAYLADMSGDGLSDLVRIRNGEVCYWPNLGHGRFGRQVVMDNPPWFDRPERFAQRRIRLADLDGSGTTDVVYLTDDGADLYFNQSGNRFADRRPVSAAPGHGQAAVQVVDLLGTGTACLVWSSPLPADAARSLTYVDLMAKGKPHLLVEVANNLGGETRVSYTPSTRFYLADRAAGRPWLTRVPFPVHVVERVETLDRVNHSRLVTRYAYHHGFYDGYEREFRGFGMVEQWDSEELDIVRADPPVATLTRSWYHTGAYRLRDRISDYFAGLLAGETGEYYREPGLTDEQARQLLLDDTVLPTGLTAAEEREACRALKGALLRQELYAPDGGPRAAVPYTVTEQNFTIRVVQRRGDNPYSAFFTHPRESLTRHYERDPTDPRVTHKMTIEVDAYGNVLQSAAVAYGRRQADPALPPPVRAAQACMVVTGTVAAFTNPVEAADHHRTAQPYEVRSYELTGLAPRPGGNRLTLDQVRTALATAADLDHEGTPTPGAVERRLIEHVHTLYRADDLSRALDPGEVETLALPYETYRRALSPGLVADVYGGWVDDGMLGAAGYVRLPGQTGWWAPSGRVFLSANPGDAAPQELAAARRHFFLPRRHRSPFPAIGAPAETVVDYDAHDLLTLETRDALGNRVTAGVRALDPAQPLVAACLDYRVLLPALVMDPNRNRTATDFDAFGLVAAVAVMGKPEDVPVPGDRLPAGYPADLTEAQTVALLADPRGPLAAQLLGTASTRIVHDVGAYRRAAAGALQPAAVLSLARETHAADPVPTSGLRIQARLAYSDGFGREVQRKAPADDGPVPQRDATGRIVLDADGRPVPIATDQPRWVGSGWTVYDGKGRPVREFEPFFTDTHRFEFEPRIGVSPIVLYDPVDRVVGRVHPDHSWDKVVVGAWWQATWDANDTVLADPAADSDVGPLVAVLPAADRWPTWHGLRTDPTLATERERIWPDAARRAAEAAAVTCTEMHASTPTLSYTDPLGRVVLTVRHNRFLPVEAPAGTAPTEEFQRTRLVLDIEGNQLVLVDARDRVAQECQYDMLGHRVTLASIDSGRCVTLAAVTGQPVFGWDAASVLIRTEYDPLQRPIRTLVTPSGGAEVLTTRNVYGEQHPDAEAANLRGRLYLSLDQAGAAAADRYDFRGNTAHSWRRFARDYAVHPDWRGVDAAVPTAPGRFAPATLAAALDVVLDPDEFPAEMRYDALNRPVHAITADGSVFRNGYGPGGNVATVAVNVAGETSSGQQVWTAVVTAASYDARNRQLEVVCDNGLGSETPRTRVTATYDHWSQRLTRLVTRTPQKTLQDLAYCYDPSGNVTSVADAAQPAAFFRNQRVDASSDYTYDACYRLIGATGRELLGGGAPVAHGSGDGRWLRPRAPRDVTPVGRYLETYRYDLVGNLTELRHRGTDPAQAGWTRTNRYEAAGAIDLAIDGNRLSSTIVDGSKPVTEPFGYDQRGAIVRMPHLTPDNADNLHWDAEGRLCRVDLGGGGTVHYRYDAAGRRVRKIWEKPGALVEERLYLGSLEVFRRSSGGQLRLVRDTLLVAAGNRRAALVENRRFTAPGADPAPARLARFQFDDLLGSVALELDGAGGPLSYEEFAPYGSTTYASPSATAKRFRFLGKERDGESGLYYFGARYYPPWLGRWISPDPAGPAGSVNGYGFAAENPTTMVDPDGAAPAPAEAQRLLSDAARYLWGKGFHLDQGSNEAILFEAQGGKLRNRVTGEIYRGHLQGVRENILGARTLSQEIETYVGRSKGLAAETSQNLKNLSARLWSAAATTEETVASAELLSNSSYATRFEKVVLDTGKLISEQLVTEGPRWGKEASLLPKAPLFEGLMEKIGGLARRGMKPAGVNLYNGLAWAQEFFESTTWQRIVGRAESAGAWVGAKVSGLASGAAKLGKYLQYGMAIQGGKNALDRLLSREHNQRLNVHYTSQDEPDVGQQLLFKAAATGIGLVDALAVDVKFSIGDADYADYAFRTYGSSGMSPAQRDFTEWMRVELGMVPQPRR
ncbi:SpvB/TcaC N-terminal domain-containing protein [Streptomyces chartreusis]|uniref:SpvB/TcaC N-terminal domain-containing protein n=1 Tax=Streptomyces chartreusis TaxID=1969 RepID=UPI003D90F77A